MRRTCRRNPSVLKSLVPKGIKSGKATTLSATKELTPSCLKSAQKKIFCSVFTPPERTGRGEICCAISPSTKNTQKNPAFKTFFLNFGGIAHRHNGHHAGLDR